MDELVRIAVVDDDDVYQYIIRRTIGNLMHRPHELMFYNSAENALQQLKGIATETPGALPDCMLLDINLPLLDGWEFIVEYKTMLKECGIENPTSIYLVSSSVDNTDLDRAHDHSDIMGYIVKPITPGKLEEALAKAGITL